MKQAIGKAALLVACGIVCSCAVVQQIKQLAPVTDLESTGAAGGDTPVTMLAISANPVLSPDDAVDSAQDQPVFADARNFVEAFARNFSADFALRLNELGIQPHDPGRGIPLLRVRALAYRQNCPDPDRKDACPTEVQIEGALIDSGGARVWSYSSWVEPDEMNAAGYDDYYKRLLKLMYKDQVIPPVSG